LRPQQQKLETTVRNLVAEVSAKEARIRQLAREQVALREAQEKAAATVPPSPAAVPRQVEATPPVGMEVRTPNFPRVEMPASVAAFAERIAPAERSSMPRAETSAPTHAGHESASAQRRTPPEVMNHEELLTAGAEISIGSVDLRSIYEDNKISEDGLRRLVIEHAHGGDIRAILKDEMLKKEMSFELDPMQSYDQQTPEEAPHAERQPILPPWLMNEPPMAPPDIAPVSEVPTPPPVSMPEPPEPYPQEESTRVTQHKSTIQPVLVMANVTAFVTLAVLLAVLIIIWLQH
jgi:hypothetical protein